MTQRTVLRLPTWHRESALADAASVVIDPQFADSGQAFCWMHGAEWHPTVGCSAVGTGQVLGTTPNWSDPSIRTALKAPRAVVSDYSKKLDRIDFLWYPGDPRRRVVWDFRSGLQLARWKPKIQPAEHGSWFSLPFPFDVSPDGDSIAEGGSGCVSLYRIEP